MEDILITLINASEKAACVARSCCGQSENEVLLIAEKSEEEANARFERDFKTIADVLAQEAARTVIASRFPDLAKYVRGEECSEINGVRIGLQDTVEDTAELLRRLVTPAVAERMAEAAHGDTDHGFCTNLPKNKVKIDTSDLGIWIDPIDATAEFIAGVCGSADADRGLPCVTVLIGAYLRSTGEPVIGVINQPFFNGGKGRIAWGISYDDVHEGDDSGYVVKQNNTILVSGAEKPDIIAKFKNAGWEVKSLPGAGYKLLNLVIGEAAAYIVSKGTTFRWDTCAPHAILRGRGGDIVKYETYQPITYNEPEDINTHRYCNNEGIIAYRNATILEKITDILSEC